jgi:DNA-binding NtrC family response regulator
VNAAAIPESLIEGELFGHARGAFTGAVAERAGLFEEAHRGTLFLDEIGELAPAAQSRLLRVLQEGVVRRVGENRDRSVDVRIVAATHRNLASGTDFRRDLFFRLNVLPIELPPLRSRGDDVLLLFGHALTRACRKAERPVPNLSSEAIERLRRYRWPGNVRELQNVAERIAIFGPPGHVAVEDLPSEVQEVPELPGAPDIPPGDFDLTAYLEQVEEAVLRRTLLRHDGVKARAAASLGMERNSFRYKLKKYGIEE